MASRPEDETVVISNGEEIYVWRPENREDLKKVFGTNSVTDRLKSFLQPVSSEMNFFKVKLQGYMPEDDDRLWINPQGAAMYLDRGKLGKLRNDVPARIRTEEETFETRLEFKYELTGPGTVDTVICSRGQDRKKAGLVKKHVTLDLQEELFDSYTDIGDNPPGLS